MTRWDRNLATRTSFATERCTLERNDRKPEIRQHVHQHSLHTLNLKEQITKSDGSNPVYLPFDTACATIDGAVKLWRVDATTLSHTF